MRTMNIRKPVALAALAALVLGVPGRALADDVTAISSMGDANRPASFLVGVRAGAIFPEAFNKLELNFLVEVGVAWQLPVLGHRLGIFVDGGYSQPTSAGTRTDPRVPTNMGGVSWDLTVKDIGVSAGLQWLQPVGTRLLVYGGAGYKVHFTESVIEQRAGTTDLGTNTEQSTRHGAVVRAGLGLRLGPGAAVLEVHYEYTPVDHLITGDDNTAHLAAQLGYTLFL